MTELRGLGTKRERIRAIKRLEQTKRAIRRDGYNRGVRAAMRQIETWMQPRFKEDSLQSIRDMYGTAELIHKGVKKLLKPTLENPNTTICGTKRR